MECPACNKWIDSTHGGIKKLVKEAWELEKAIIEMSEKRAVHEGLAKD